MQLSVINPTGKETQITVSDQVFNGAVNKTLISQAVRVYLANQRQGTSKVKTRGEVIRTKKKWYRQKGTGGARHGARTANIFVGGGVVHGPTGTQNWSLSFSSEQKRRALSSALAAQKEAIAVTTLLDEIKPKTKDAVEYLKRLAPDAERILIVLHQPMDNILRSVRNIPYVLVTSAQRLNVYETLLADKIIFSKEAIQVLENRLEKKTEKKVEKVEEKKEEKKVLAKKATKPAAPAKKKAVAAKPKAKAAKKKTE